MNKSVMEKALSAEGALLSLERKINDFPPPANVGVHMEVIKFSTDVRLLSVEMRFIFLKLELIAEKKIEISQSLIGIRGAVNSIFWWRKAQAEERLALLDKREESIEMVVDSHQGLIELLESHIDLFE